MVLGKGFKKGQFQRLGKGLQKVAKEANALLEGTSTQTTTTTTTTTETPQNKHGTDTNQNSPAKKPSKKKPLSFVDRLSQVAENLQQNIEGLEQNLQTMQQYDYQVETSVNEATGELVPSAVTLRDKTTGELISRTSQVLEKDGTLRVTSTGKAEAMRQQQQQQHPLGGKQPPLPPEFPKTGTIETHMVKKANDTQATVTFKVLDGPEAGRTLEYNVNEDSDGTPSSYHLVRESRPVRARVDSLLWWLVLLLLATIGALVAILGAAQNSSSSSSSTMQDFVCMPVLSIVPYNTILRSKDASRRFEAPWWAPMPLKQASFGTLCGDRPRTAVEYRGQELSILQLPEGDGKATVWLKKSRVTEARFGPKKVVLLTVNKKEKTWKAPWHAG